MQGFKLAYTQEIFKKKEGPIPCYFSQKGQKLFPKRTKYAKTETKFDKNVPHKIIFSKETVFLMQLSHTIKNFYNV